MHSILAVDDSPSMRKMVSFTLTGAGYQVVEAADGDAAIAAFRETPAQAAFVDIFMPGKEGLATIKELLELAPNLPIIAISAGSTFTDTETLGWAKSYGAQYTLPKPLAAAAVLETLGRIFG